MINDEGLVLTQGQAERLIEAIEKNFSWAREKGCTVTDQRKFIENIIRFVAGVEKWAGVDDAVA